MLKNLPQHCIIFSPHPTRTFAAAHGQEEREGSSLKPSSRGEAAAQGHMEEETCQEGKRWRSTAEKEAAALKGIRGGNRKNGLMGSHGKDETSGHKDNRIKDRSKIFKH